MRHRHDCTPLRREHEAITLDNGAGHVVFSQEIHIEIAVSLDPVFMRFHRQCPDQPQADRRKR